MIRFSLLLLSLAFATTTMGQTRVRGYFKKDGTYVQPHVRTNPDGNFYNNYSSKGNINPYTGKEGTKDYPSSSYYGYYGDITPNNNYSTQNTYQNYGNYTVTERPRGSIQQNRSTESIIMTFYDKGAYDRKEVFSLKNNTGTAIRSISMRLIYYSLSGDVIDYRDFVLSGEIPSGMAKMFNIRAFNTEGEFVYVNHNSTINYMYNQYDIRFMILDYK